MLPLASASGCCAATLEFLAFALKREEGKKRMGATARARPVSVSQIEKLKKNIEKFQANVYMAQHRVPMGNPRTTSNPL